MEQIKSALDEAGYDYAVAIATQAEINAGAACGQLSIIIEEHPEIVDKILMEGTAKAQKTAKETMKKVKKAMRLDY